MMEKAIPKAINSCNLIILPLLIILFYSPTQTILAQCTATDVGGTVYQEFNMNGQADLETDKRFAEPTLSGVNVTVYDMNGTTLGTATTGPSGDWLVDVSGASDDSVQVVFDIPTGYESGPHGNDNNSSVQYTVLGNCTVDFTVGVPEQHCEDSPPLALVCFNNDPADAEPTIITMDYCDTQDYTGQQDQYPPTLYPSPYVQAAKTVVATQGDVQGSGWIAWNSTNQLLYSGVYHKWQLATNVGEMGKLFATDLSGATATTNLWLDLNTVFGAGVAGTYTGTNAALDRSNVGYIGFTDIEISDDNTMLFVYNAADRSVYVIPINPDGSANTTGIKIFPIPEICPGNHTWGGQPPLTAAGGLGYYDGRIYASATCTGPTTTDLLGRVYSFDPTGTPGTTTVQTEFDIDYSQWTIEPVRICGGICCCNSDINNTWTIWKDVHISTTDGSGSEIAPWLFDIVFDEYPDGTVGMSVATRNRAAETYDSDENPDPTPGGYLSRACFDGSSWNIEVNGDCGTFQTGLDPTAASGASATNNIFDRGQPDATFYHGEGLEGPAINGALETITSFKEIVGTATDNVYGDYDSGIMFHSLADGTRTRDANLIQGSTTEFAKGISWGDIEALCEPASIEIGNLVWKDDGDGLQEPNEKGLAGITVNLYEDTNGNGIIDVTENTPVATKITDANGNYYFTSADDGLKYNTDYIIALDNPADYVANALLDSTDITIDNINSNGTDLRDSDGVDPGTGYPQVALTTGGQGQNNHTYDFGFVCCPKLKLTLTTDTICIDETFDISMEFTIDTVTYSLYYNFANNLLTQQEVYDQNGTTLLTTFTPNLGSTDTILTAQTLPANTSDTIQVYYLYMVFQDSTQLFGDCALVMDTAQIVIFPETLEATLTPNEEVCLSRQAENSHVYNLDSLITAGATTGIWSDDNASGGLVGSVFTATNAMAGNTYNFTYTIAGMPGAAANSPCLDNTYTVSIEVKDFCCPELISINNIIPFCTGETQAGPIDITINHSVEPQTLALYYSTDSTLTATDLYATGNGGATAINTAITPITATTNTTAIGVIFPANTGTSIITYTVYAILGDGNSFIVDPDCLPVTSTQVDIYPLPVISSATIFACDNNDGNNEEDGSTQFTLEDADTLITSNSAHTVTYYASQSDADARTPTIASPYTANTGSIIYARIETVNGCYRVAEVTLSLHPLPPVATTSIQACDKNDGRGDFILTDADAFVDVDGGNTVTYYLSQADADSNTDALASPLDTIDATVLYARVQNQYGCFRTTPIELELLPSPILQDANFEECDSGDGTAEFDLSGTNSYYPTLTDAQNETNALPDSYVSSGEIIYIRVNATNSCFTIRQITLIVLPLPVATDDSLDMCDNDAGTVDFTLSDADMLVDTTIINTVTYHINQIDALQDINALTSPYSSSGNEVIWARVEDVNGCFSTAQLTLIITPLPNIAPAALEACNNGDDTADFTLTDANTTVDVDGGNTVTYHANQSDADAGINALTSPYTSTATTIYARVTDDNACYRTDTINLSILPLPAAADANLYGCDDGDGNLDFTLTAADALVDTIGGNTITYHADMLDAQSGLNPLASPYASSGEMIYVRVEDGNGCFATATLTLNIVTPPTATPITVEACDNGDGTADFDLAMQIPNIDATGLHTTTFHESQAHADADTNAVNLPYSSVAGTIYARVTDQYGCYGTAEITLVVKASPILSNTEVSECDRGDGTAEFDLSALGITYYPTLTDAENESNALPSSYTTANDTIYSRVNNTNDCFVIATVVLTVLPMPNAMNTTFEACDDGNGSASITLSDIDDSVTTDSLATVSYFSNQLDAFNNNNALASPYVTSGGETLYVRVVNQNGCFALSEVVLNISPLPTANNASLSQCDLGDGTADFTLTAVDSLANGGTTNQVTYHSTQADADAGINALVSPYNSAGGDIYIRVATPDDCYQTAILTLTILPLPTASNATETKCDVGGDLIEDFDLTSFDSQVDASDTNTISYHATTGDATANINPLSSPYSTTGTTLYARVENADGCFVMADITLTVNPTPVAAPAEMELCDAGNDGTEDFDLSTLDATVDTTASHAVTYHLTQAEADNGTDPVVVPFASGTTTLYARVANLFGCYTTSEITLTLNPVPEVAPANLEVCDLGNGTADFVLTLADNDVDTTGGNTVTYHASQTDAESSMNPLVSPYNSANATIYARVENIYGCFEVTPVTLVVSTAPIVENAELRECDLGDGTAEFDLTTSFGSYYSTMTDAENETNPITGSSYTSVNDTLYLRANSTNGCYNIAIINLIVNPVPMVNNVELEACDDGDGAIEFDLAETDTLVTTDVNVVISYHESPLDATTGNNPLASNLYESTSTTIYARVVNEFGCFSIAEVTLTVHPLPTVTGSNLTLCNEGGGVATFTLPTADGTNSLSYFSSLADAENNINILENPYPSMGGTIYVRSEDRNGCFATAEVNLTVEPLPLVANAFLEACDNGDGTADFTLSFANSQVDVNGGNTVTYYASSDDANAGSPTLSSPYTAVDATVIYARATTSAGCFAISTVTLNIGAQPELQDMEVRRCDRGDGVAIFDVSPTDEGVYYGSLQDALNENNPLDGTSFVSGSAVVYFRVNTSAGCSSIAQYTFTVVPLPSINSAQLNECTNDTTVAVNFDLTQADALVDLDGTNTVTYYTSLANATNNVSVLPTNYNSLGETLYVRIENSDACFEIAELELIVTPCPPICPPKRCIPIMITKK